MISLLLAATLSLPADTLEVRPGDVLVTESLHGELFVQGWDGDRAEVVRSDVALRFERRGSEVHLRRVGRGDPEGDVHLRVPRGLALRIYGASLDLVVEGVEADVDVDILEGDVDAERITGRVRIGTLDGDIRLETIRGDVAVSTLDGEIGVRDVRGDVRLDTTDGDLGMIGVRGRRIHASTVDGDVEFDGTLEPGGELTLVTHDGDVTVRVPGDVGATVEVSTFEGNFESDFPVRVRSVMATQALRFELGDGSGRISIRSFDGDIRLLRR